MRLIRENVPFTQISNDVLNNKELSWKAKGLYSYLYSKPDGWDFSIERIINDCQDGRDSTTAWIKELEAFWLLTRKKQVDGKMDYIIGFLASNSPNTEKPNLGKTQLGKTRCIINKEKDSNKEIIKNKESENDIFFSLLIEKDWEKPTMKDEDIALAKSKSKTISLIFEEWNKNLLYKKKLFEFFLYWTARTQKGREKWKQLWQTKETFDLYRRWARFRKDIDDMPEEKKTIEARKISGAETKKVETKQQDDYYDKGAELEKKRAEAQKKFGDLPELTQKEIEERAMKAIYDMPNSQMLSEMVIRNLIEARKYLIVRQEYL